MSEKPYQLHEVDLAGNDYSVGGQFATFEEALIEYHRRKSPNHLHYIINLDLADIDFDGLTEEEREQAP